MKIPKRAFLIWMSILASGLGSLAGAQGRVGEIRDEDVLKVQNRQKALRMTSAGFGPAWSAQIGKEEVMYGASVGQHWEVNTMAEMVAEIGGAANRNGSMINGGIGFNLLPITGPFSPVVGAEFGFGYGRGKDRNGLSISNGDFSLQGNLGVRLFRTSDAQMEIMGTYTAVLDSPSPRMYGAQLRVLF